MAPIATFTDHSSIFADWVLLVSIHGRLKNFFDESSNKYVYFHFNCSLLSESPRWLISKGREAKAYKILFNKKYDTEYTENEVNNKQKEAEQSAKVEPQRSRWQNMFKELSALYGPPRLRRMALICHFTWCVTALSYYVTGLLIHCLCCVRTIKLTILFLFILM